MKFVMQQDRQNGDSIYTKAEPLFKGADTHKFTVERTYAQPEKVRKLLKEGNKQVSTFILDSEEEVKQMLVYIFSPENGFYLIPKRIQMLYDRANLGVLYAGN